MANQGAFSSSAPFTKSWKYHVFLSFRGFDTRSNFTSHLYSALRREGINTFMDDDELRRGEEISNALLTAIEDSKISVVVFSENHASSKWCLDELVKILDCKESNQQLVIPIFYKVDPSDVRNQTGSFGDALAHLESKYKDNMDKVNRWRGALSQAGKLSGFTLGDRESEAEFIQKIIEEISAHVIDRTYLKVAEHPVGMQPHVQDMNKLLEFGEKDVRMVGVWGTGGIGKTTVAKVVYNSIAHEFEGSCFLANVRECSMWHGGLAKIQENLLSDILRVKNLEVPNVHIGATMIQERLSGRKILLVLDDVNDIEQLRNLAGAHWFGVGSRIIITARDKQLLTAHDVKLIHEVKILDNHKALELFSWHAFKTDEPLDDYVELAERAIRYAQGLPLALTVLGSCLYGGRKDKWQAALQGFKSSKIQEVLKISYNALDDIVKEVFLDIACFFKGKSINYAIETLEACDLNPRYGIEVLIEKALISVEESYIQMHDLLEEMGKEIVHQESPTEPGERSRLWFHEDVDHVLTNSTGTNKITRIMLNFPDRDDDEIHFNIDSFSEMKNLKLFINYNAFLYGDVGHLPNKLRVLHWYGCPYQSFLPNFRSKELVVLNLTRNRLKQPGERLKHFTKLTSLNLSVSVFLTEIPDLSSIPNLKYLYALYCSSLVEVHPSVGYLGKLEVLDLTGCPRLAKFPKKVWWKSLKRFLLSFCKMFESFPEVVDKMEFICELNLDGTAIKELPSSIGHLTGLTTLSLCFTPLKELPSSIGYLTRLEYLALKGCRNVTNLPQSIYGLQHLEVLDLNSCSKLTLNLNSEVLLSAESLPLGVLSNSNISHDNFGSLAFPELQYVYFEECNLSDIDFLENFGSSSELHRMVLCRNNFISLPVCISKFVNLRQLDLSCCKMLREIVQLPPNIEEIDVGDCISLERFSALEDGNMQLIRVMDMCNCHRLCDNLYVSNIANILLNQMKKDKIEVKLRGTEVPEWFSCRKDVGVLLNKDYGIEPYYDDICELVVEIPRTFKWEDAKLVLCAVFENYCGGSFNIEAGVTIDGVDTYNNIWLSSRKIESAHVWLLYIPLADYYIEPNVNDKESDDQLKKFYMCRVTFSYGGERLLFKSCGFHLAYISMPKDGDDSKNDENELDDDDVGDEVRPRKRKKISPLIQCH